MVDYREIIRLKSAGYSNSSVASSTGSGRNKVAEVWKRAGEKNISWPIPGSLTNEDLKPALYPELKDSSLRMLPDYEHIHEELAKPGVTLTLLWSEYLKRGPHCAHCARYVNTYIFVYKNLRVPDPTVQGRLPVTCTTERPRQPHR